jgi:uncharacterized membrane protein YjdF
VFASAVGADHEKGQIGFETARLAVSIPLTIYVLGLWLVRERYQLQPLKATLMLFFEVLIAAIDLNEQP